MNEIIKNPANEINQLHNEIKMNMSDSLMKAIKIGEMLTNFRVNVPHGEWTAWCRDNLTFHEDTAGKYIKLYKRQNELPADKSDLGFIKALNQLTNADIKEPDKSKPTINVVAYRMGHSLATMVTRLEAILQHKAQINKYHLFMIVESVRRIVNILEREGLYGYQLPTEDQRED